MQDLVRTEIRPPVARLTIRGRRHLDGPLVDALHRAWDAVEAREDLELVSFDNEGDDFLVGVDGHWVVERMEADDLAAIEDFVRNGQGFLRRLDSARPRTLARVRGFATGAGAEWIAACDAVLATADSRIGLPETGLGIHPALGGTQRLPRRIGFAAARWAILTGTYLSAAGARTLGLVDALEDEDDRAAASATGRRAAEIARAPRRREGLDDALLRAFEHRTLPELCGGPRPDDPTDLQRALRRVARRAPVALRVADTLLHLSTQTDLEHGLRREVEELATVYATRDALAGMRASAAGRRATRFHGH